MSVTEQDARALTYLAKRLREETRGANRWDEAGIFAIVAKLVGRNLAVTIEQVARHAADAEAKTPGAITRPFLPDAPKGEVRFPPKREHECRAHPGEWADACRPCATEERAVDAGARVETSHADIDHVRAVLAQTRGALCGHGVPRGNCLQEHETHGNGPLAAEQDSRGATGHHDDMGAQRGDSAKGDH